jgi:hypothetical protein
MGLPLSELISAVPPLDAKMSQRAVPMGSVVPRRSGSLTPRSALLAADHDDRGDQDGGDPEDRCPDFTSGAWAVL